MEIWASVTPRVPRVFAQWWFVLMTLLTSPLTTLENPRLIHGQNPSSKP
jgi:hypothetical protein